MIMQSEWNYFVIQYPIIHLFLFLLSVLGTHTQPVAPSGVDVRADGIADWSRIYTDCPH